ncbi:MAG: hypothetical protein P4N59_24175 [Negativicutes bacterium]|nr:hypothetical protein [Negativicutes bacterium]
MKSYAHILSAIVLLAIGGILKAQDDSSLDLSTRCVGTPPSHVTVNSVVQWMENPLDQELQVCVSNFCAASSDYMEIDLADNRLKFYGAGVDDMGHYIPTNYSPITISAVLRHQYNLNVMCPNSGPKGSPLFQPSDFGNPDSFIFGLTNGYYDPAVDTFLWSHFTGADQSIFADGDPNEDPALEGLRQTNLVKELNQIVTSMPFYTNSIFASYTNLDNIAGLLAQNPTGQQIWYINRLLLEASIHLAANHQVDNSCDASACAGVTGMG